MMLQAMKTRTAKWVIRVFAVLLIISFAAWGVGDMITGRGLPTDVAEVGGTKVSAREFNERFRREVSRLRSVLGPQLDSNQARQLGIADTTLETLIAGRLLAMEARDLGLIVGDDQVKQAILQQTAFRNAAGQFDQAIFQQALAQSGLTEAGFVEGLRGDLTRSHLTGIISSGSTAPAHLVDQLYRYRNEKRVAEVVVIPRDAGKAPPEPSDGEAREFHKKNAAVFSAPEMRDITAIYLDPEKRAEETDVSESKLRDEYESRLSSMSVPERRLLRQILTPDEATARRVLDRLKTGADFTAVAKEIAGQNEDATKLGLLTFNDLPKDLAEAAFKLAEKTPGEPFQSPLGWHVLLAEKIEPGKTPTFEEVRTRLRTELARELAVDGLVALANRLEDSLAGGASIEEAAEQIAVPVIKVASLDTAGRVAGGAKAPNLPKSGRFLETVFSTEQGQSSDMVETSDGGYFIVRVENVTPPALRPFDSVRADVAKAWKRSRRDEAARKRAEALRDRIRGGKSLASVAGTDGLKLVTSKEFTRFSGDADSGIPPTLATQLFRVGRGEVAMAPTPQGYAVAVVKDIRGASPSADKAGFDALRKQIGATMGNDILSQFTGALRVNYPVSIDRGAMDRLFNDTDTNR